ncbi:ROK family protein [Salinisphaera sp. T31B1]|uniref:ROK family protein n=1 Tax=Salinisphaera sp. T31B1 TaxID=727963 RepID=UPI0033400A19
MKGSAMRLGVDLGGTKIAGIVLGEGDRVVAERRVDTPSGDYRATIAAIKALVDALESEAGVERLPLGIGTPGSVVPGTRRMRNANSQCLNGRPLADDLQCALAREVRIANDADCLALSEAHDGAAAGAASVFGVILGTGVGGGVIVEGRPLRGCNGLVGEWGHINLPWPTASEARQPPRCWCGLDGCLETWLSGPGMSADHLRRGGSRLDAEEIVARAEAGERLAGATLRAWLRRVARAMALVINLIDPEAIVVGGGLSQIRWLYSEVPKIWTEHVFADGIETRLLPALHGDASGVRGAARLWPMDTTTA